MHTSGVSVGISTSSMVTAWMVAPGSRAAQMMQQQQQQQWCSSVGFVYCVSVCVGICGQEHLTAGICILSCVSATWCIGVSAAARRHLIARCVMPFLIWLWQQYVQQDCHNKQQGRHITADVLLPMDLSTTSCKLPGPSSRTGYQSTSFCCSSAALPARARKLVDGSKFTGRRPEISEIVEGSSTS
jgi:hypothetical protein